ncbi:unnamed protein product [Tuber aestivum]|uniref:Uncharacterized protein n=1 Tax=Tuber aestivum TaxID=59557 RepID=A0A292PUJ9_9PEZI|nr:unnamed protein product [Tuber aestivum]
MAPVPTSIIVADARSGRKDAKGDAKNLEENVDRLGKALAHTNNMIKEMDKRLTLVEHNRNFMQAFALQSAVKIMKAIYSGDTSDREEAKKFIRDGEELMGCMERGGESSTLSGIYADRG